MAVLPRHPPSAACHVLNGANARRTIFDNVPEDEPFYTLCRYVARNALRADLVRERKIGGGVTRIAGSAVPRRRMPW